MDFTRTCVELSEAELANGRVIALAFGRLRTSLNIGRYGLQSLHYGVPRAGLKTLRPCRHWRRDRGAHRTHG